jgi:hypothetical protein
MKAILSKDEFGTLAEHFRPEYIAQTDGSYKLKVEAVNGLSLEDVSGLRRSVEAARAERDEATTKLRIYDGLDVVKAKEAMTKLEELTKDPDKKVDKLVEDKAVGKSTCHQYCNSRHH